MPEAAPRKIRYRRVPGARGPMVGLTRSVLRLADDHLLVSESPTGFTEMFRRFYFADIQAFIIRKTARWLISASIWGLLAFLFLWLGVHFDWNWIVTSIIFICFCLLLVSNFWRGPTCRTYVQTAVQTIRLPMLRRVPQARRVVDRLQPLIQQAQSSLVSAVASTSSVSPAIPGLVSDSVPAPTTPAPLSHLHVITFGLAIASGGLALLELWLQSKTTYTFWLIAFAASVCVAIVTLARQGRRAVHHGAVVIVWLLVVGDVLGVIISNSIFAFLQMVASLPGVQPGQPPKFSVSPLTPYVMRHLPGFDYVLWTYALAAIPLAVVGLIFAFRPVMAKGQPPPLPAAA